MRHEKAVRVRLTERRSESEDKAAAAAPAKAAVQRQQNRAADAADNDGVDAARGGGERVDVDEALRLVCERAALPCLRDGKQQPRVKSVALNIEGFCRESVAHHVVGHVFLDALRHAHVRGLGFVLNPRLLWGLVDEAMSAYLLESPSARSMRDMRRHGCNFVDGRERVCLDTRAPAAAADPLSTCWDKVVRDVAPQRGGGGGGDEDEERAHARRHDTGWACPPVDLRTEAMLVPGACGDGLGEEAASGDNPNGGGISTLYFERPACEWVALFHSVYEFGTIGHSMVLRAWVARVLWFLLHVIEYHDLCTASHAYVDALHADALRLARSVCGNTRSVHTFRQFFRLVRGGDDGDGDSATAAAAEWRLAGYALYFFPGPTGMLDVVATARMAGCDAVDDAADNVGMHVGCVHLLHVRDAEILTHGLPAARFDGVLRHVARTVVTPLRTVDVRVYAGHLGYVYQRRVEFEREPAVAVVSGHFAVVERDAPHADPLDAARLLGAHDGGDNGNGNDVIPPCASLLGSRVMRDVQCSADIGTQVREMMYLLDKYECSVELLRACMFSLKDHSGSANDLPRDVPPYTAASGSDTAAPRKRKDDAAAPRGGIAVAAQTTTTVRRSGDDDDDDVVMVRGIDAALFTPRVGGGGEQIVRTSDNGAVVVVADVVVADSGQGNDDYVGRIEAAAAALLTAAVEQAPVPAKEPTPVPAKEPTPVPQIGLAALAAVASAADAKDAVALFDRDGTAVGAGVTKQARRRRGKRGGAAAGGKPRPVVVRDVAEVAHACADTTVLVGAVAVNTTMASAAEAVHLQEENEAAQFEQEENEAAPLQEEVREAAPASDGKDDDAAALNVNEVRDEEAGDADEDAMSDFEPPAADDTDAILEASRPLVLGLAPARPAVFPLPRDDATGSRFFDGAPRAPWEPVTMRVVVASTSGCTTEAAAVRRFVRCCVHPSLQRPLPAAVQHACAQHRRGGGSTDDAWTVVVARSHTRPALRCAAAVTPTPLLKVMGRVVLDDDASHASQPSAASLHRWLLHACDGALVCAQCSAANDAAHDARPLLVESHGHGALEQFSQSLYEALASVTGGSAFRACMLCKAELEDQPATATAASATLVGTRRATPPRCSLIVHGADARGTVHFRLLWHCANNRDDECAGHCCSTKSAAVRGLAATATAAAAGRETVVRVLAETGDAGDDLVLHLPTLRFAPL